MPIHVRWMFAGDLPTVLAIDTASFQNPWGRDEYLQLLKCQDVIGMVAEFNYFVSAPVVGLMLYRLFPRGVKLLRIAVDPKHRRKRVGLTMLAKLDNKMRESHRRSRIRCAVRESQLDAHLFFRAAGYRATDVVRNAFRADVAIDAPEDAYRFLRTRGTIITATKIDYPQGMRAQTQNEAK